MLDRTAHLDCTAHLDRWRELHHGYDPTSRPVVLVWLTAMYDVAAPLARRRVAPDLLTFVGGDLAAGALALALLGGRWPVASAVLLLLSGVLDGLDGAVAVIAQRESPRGARLDRLVDRFSDLCFVGALVAVGAALPLGLAAAAALLVLEGLRARWARGRRAGLGTATVGERPTRLVLCGLGLLGAGAAPAYSGEVATVAALALAGLCALSVIQLARAVRRP
ncbi:MAG TPA: CDP-alcohol phosphatidyltransferase family protein [Mycobacteriales bacterium]|nr:CDP-alcohol phosphatidyltransferase family protein [Mycobacteriales bacterium]